jgi:hypothetical protein
LESSRLFFSAIFLFPAVQARAYWEDYDAHRIRRELHHEYCELREDLRRGDYGAAAHERAEINRLRYELHSMENGPYPPEYGYGYGPYRYAPPPYTPYGNPPYQNVPYQNGLPRIQL